MKSKIQFALLYSLFFTLSLLPLRILYFVADFIAWLAHDVVKYRRNVVSRNLREAFPERQEVEIKKIARGFYNFLADYFVETVKLTTMGKRQICRRMRFEDTEEAKRCLESGRNVTLYLGHYCNWEWISSLPLHLPKGPIVAGQIYHPLEDRGADKVFYKIRSRFGACNIAMADTLQTIMKWRKEKKTSIIGYIADQAPGYNGVHLFLDFLNHDTPVFTGAERISRMLDSAVFYCHIDRPKRGEYVCRLVKMTENAAEPDKFELTRRYFSLLEQQIRERPEYWLWSHRRWKRGREGFMEFHGPNALRQLSRL